MKPSSRHSAAAGLAQGTQPNSSRIIEVLLAECSTRDIERVLAALKTAHVNVTVIPDLSEAHQHISAVNVDVMLLGSGMPEGPAVAQFAEVRASHPGLTIVALVDRDRAADDLEGVGAGVNDILTPDQLEAPCLRRYIYRAAAHTRNRRELIACRQQLRMLSATLSQVEERERRKVAERLHDGPRQMLGIALPKLEILKDKDCPPQMSEELGGVIAMIWEATQQIRAMANDLTPPELHLCGFETALQTLASRSEPTYGVRLEIDSDDQPKPLNRDKRNFLFQSVRELIFNASRHGDASRVSAEVRRVGREMILTVRDDGTGFDSALWKALQPSPTSFGLANMRERLQSIGGRFDVESRPGCGSCVMIAVPLDENAG